MSVVGAANGAASETSVRPLRSVGILAAVCGCLVGEARATDVWTNVRPGVDWLHRTTGGGTPQDIHAVRIDLSLPNIGIRASRDEGGAERGVTTSTFADDVGALVATGGDWSNGWTPVGLAIGNGWRWHDHYSDPNISSQWGYIGCTIDNQCEIDNLEPLGTSWWFGAPERSPYRYFNAVGANGVLLYNEGVRQNGCYDGCAGDSCRHPRTAICTTPDGYLWMITIDGRRSDAAGMRCGEVRDLVLELGCDDAAMLDGGGSTTMWIDGAVRNEPSDGAQRTLANHIGITYTDAVDPACALPGGAWCEGSVIHTCNGGQVVGEGDCAAFGLSCGEDGGWAFCVDPRCPGGDGMGLACIDGDQIESCTDGVYGTGSCGVFGLVCGEDDLGAGCMDSRCQAGPHRSFCAGDTVIGQCTDGTYAEATCAEGQRCADTAAGGQCIDARCTSGPEGSFCVGEGVLARCQGGIYAEEDCSAAGWLCATDGGATLCAHPDCASAPNGTFCADGYTLGICTAGQPTSEPCPEEHRCEPVDVGAACVFAPSPTPAPGDDDSVDATPLPFPADGTTGCACGTSEASILPLALPILWRRARRRRPFPSAEPR